MSQLCVLMGAWGSLARVTAHRGLPGTRLSKRPRVRVSSFGLCLSLH